MTKSKLLLIHRPLPKTLEIWVTPNASFNRVRQEVLGDDTTKLYLHLSAPAQDGKANRMLIKILTKELGIAKGDIKIIAGEKHRHKILEIKTK